MLQRGNGDAVERVPCPGVSRGAAVSNDDGEVASTRGAPWNGKWGEAETPFVAYIHRMPEALAYDVLGRSVRW